MRIPKEEKLKTPKQKAKVSKNCEPKSQVKSIKHEIGDMKLDLAQYKVELGSIEQIVKNIWLQPKAEEEAEKLPIETSLSEQSLVSNPQSKYEDSTSTSSDEGKALVVYNNGNKSTSQSQTTKDNYLVNRTFNSYYSLLFGEVLFSTNKLPSNLSK